MTSSPRLKHGLHPDPIDPAVEAPDRSAWPDRLVRAHASKAMAAYRGGLLRPDSDDVRASVLDDLSEYFSLSPEECAGRCVDWETWSVEEWRSRDASDGDGLKDFLLHTESWCFDLLWYAYLQTEGFCYPVSVAVADTLPATSGGAHLDFGSGIGATSQMFARLGYSTEMADISTSLMNFARFRFSRRGYDIAMIDLNHESLPENRYDVITAIDTLVHIPDLPIVMGNLHRALKPGGLLFTNFDVRPRTLENHAFLYADDRPLRRMLQRTGFEQEELLDGMIIRYRKVEPTGVAHKLRGARDAVQFGPLRPLYRGARDRLQALRRAKTAG